MIVLEENFAMVYRWENSKMLPSSVAQEQYSLSWVQQTEKCKRLVHEVKP